MAVIDKLNAMFGPLVEDLGYEFVGLEYHPHPSNGMLRIYIDNAEAGIDVDDCAKVSREVSALLDVEDPISGHYNLEVSSPGMDRPLFRPDQYAQFIGETVKLTVSVPVEGRRKFTAEIRAVDGDQITIAQDGEDVVIEHPNVAKARLVPVFD